MACSKGFLEETRAGGYGRLLFVCDVLRWMNLHPGLGWMGYYAYRSDCCRWDCHRSLLRVPIVPLAAHIYPDLLDRFARLISRMGCLSALLPGLTSWYDWSCLVVIIEGELLKTWWYPNMLLSTTIILLCASHFLSIQLLGLFQLHLTLTLMCKPKQRVVSAVKRCSQKCLISILCLPCLFGGLLILFGESVVFISLQGCREQIDKPIHWLLIIFFILRTHFHMPRLPRFLIAIALCPSLPVSPPALIGWVDSPRMNMNQIIIRRMWYCICILECSYHLVENILVLAHYLVSVMHCFWELVAQLIQGAWVQRWCLLLQIEVQDRWRWVLVSAWCDSSDVVCLWILKLLRAHLLIPCIFCIWFHNWNTFYHRQHLGLLRVLHQFLLTSTNWYPQVMRLCSLSRLFATTPLVDRAVIKDDIFLRRLDFKLLIPFIFTKTSSKW